MSDNLIVLSRDLVLSYILEPNKKIYFVIIDDGRVYCSESKDRAMVFAIRDYAIKFVDEIKKMTNCEFQIEEV